MLKTLIIFLLFNCLQLFSQEQWEEVVPAQGVAFENINVVGNYIYQIGLNGNLSKYDIQAKKFESQKKIGYGYVQANEHNNENFYVFTCATNFSASAFLKLDSNFNILKEVPFLDGKVLISFQIIGDKILFSGLDLKNNNAGFIGTTDTAFENLKFDYVMGEFNYESKITALKYSNGKAYFLTYSGNLYVMDNINELKWVRNEVVSSFDLENARGLFVKDNIILIIDEYGRTIISFDGGNTFEEKANLGYEFRLFSCIMKNNKIIISGNDKIKKTGYVVVSEDYGDNWKIIFENSSLISNLDIANSKIYCQIGDGSVYSIDEEKYLTIEKQLKESCITVIPIGYFDMLGNRLESKDIYNKQIVVRYKCLETGKIFNRLEIKTIY